MTRFRGVETALEKFTWLQKAKLRQEEYLQKIATVLEEQQRKDSMPMGWDANKSLWENVIEQGTEHFGEWTFPRATKVVKILSKVGA